MHIAKTPPPSPRPQSVARTDVTRVMTALTTATLGDSVELSAAALAESDRLTASRSVELEQSRADSRAAPVPPPAPDESMTPATGPAPQPIAASPRWDHLPYAPPGLPTPAAHPPHASAPALRRLATIALVTLAFTVAILLGAIIG